MIKKSQFLESKKDIIALMYLIDEIKRGEFPNISVMSMTEFKKIEVDIINKGDEIDAKTISRAFEYSKKINGTRPSYKKLDVLTRYFTKGQKGNFRAFQEDIESVYLKAYRKKYDSILSKLNKVNNSENNNQNKDFKEENIINNSLEQSTTTNNQIHVSIDNKNNGLPILGIVAITVISIFGFFSYSYWQNSKNNKCGYWEIDRYITVPCDIKKQGVQIQNINIKEININTFRKITPTKETEFFNKETKQPKMWYAVSNNQTDFFNAQGNHPVTGVLLRPVTKEIVKTYIIKKETISEKIDLSEDKTVIKIEKTSIKADTKISILNNNILDEELSIYFKKNYKNVNEKYTCKGTIRYQFRKSTLNEKLIVCNLTLRYTVVSNKTQKEIDINFVNSKGSGFSENQAKQNAISNIEF